MLYLGGGSILLQGGLALVLDHTNLSDAMPVTSRFLCLCLDNRDITLPIDPVDKLCLHTIDLFDTELLRLANECCKCLAGLDDLYNAPCQHQKYDRGEKESEPLASQSQNC